MVYSDNFNLLTEDKMFFEHKKSCSISYFRIYAIKMRF
jgi:hypothetical protein